MTPESILKRLEKLPVKFFKHPEAHLSINNHAIAAVDAKHINKLIFDIKKSLKESKK